MLPYYPLPLIAVSAPNESGLRYCELLEAWEPSIAEGAYGLVETARDLDAFLAILDGDSLDERENRRRLRTRPTEFSAAVPGLGDTLVRVLDLMRTAATSPEHLHLIARGAHEVAMWAEHRGSPATALIFAQLAHEIHHHSGAVDPQLAFDLGRFAVAIPDEREAGVACLRLAAEEALAAGLDALAEEASALAALDGGARA